MTEYKDTFAALMAPFDPNAVKHRQGGRGMTFSYVTARTVMNRLDEVLGPENWWDEYIPGGNSVMCKLTVRLPDGMIVTKVDAGGYAPMDDHGDGDKSGFSDAFKRAAAKFGVGRYLYGDGLPSFAGDVPVPVANNDGYRQDGPARNGHQSSGNAPRGNGSSGLPKSGKALFAWACDKEKETGFGVVKFLTAWGKSQGFPDRMVEWDDSMVADGHAEVMRKVSEHSPEAASVMDGTIRRKQEELKKAVRDLLASRGIFEPKRHDAANVLNELSGHIEVGGEVIHSVEDCHDAGLLGRYIAACGEVIGTESQF